MKTKVPLPELLHFRFPNHHPYFSGDLPSLAQTLKSWAKERGALYYSYWTQPLRHFVINPMDIEDLDAHSLLHREIEGVGFVKWDFLSSPFLVQKEDCGHILYIPSLVFSLQSEALDWKIPLLRAEEKIGAVLSRFFKWMGIEEGKWASLFRVAKSSFPERVSLAVDRDILLMESIHELKLNLPEKKIDWTLLPTDDLQKNQLLCLALAAAMKHALFEHKDLFSISLASFGEETPFFTVDLSWEEEENTQASKEKPFCTFTGSGFSFEGMASFANPAFFLCVVQAAFADSLSLIVDELLHDKEPPLAIFQRKIKAKEKSLPIAFKVYSSDPFLDPKSIRCFAGILSEIELLYFQKIRSEDYVSWMQKKIEEMKKHFLPKILEKSKEAKKIFEELDRLQEEIWDFGAEAKAKVLFELARPKMKELKNHWKKEKN